MKQRGQKNFDDLAELLKAKFTKNENFGERQNKFSKIKQIQGQKVNDLAEVIKSATSNYINIEENDTEAFHQLKHNLMLTKFMEALRPDIKVEVQKLGPKTFKQAVEFSENVERALEENVNLIEVVNNVEVNHLMQTQLQNNLEIEKLKAELNKLKEEKQIAERNQNTQIRCHICNKGHITTKCWQYPTNNRQDKAENNYNYNPYHKFKSVRGQNRGARSFRPYRGNRFSRRSNLN